VRAGHIELAAGGVLFLDEVSEMSVSSQAKFLRVLQEREFERLGGTRVQKTNVRVVAPHVISAIGVCLNLDRARFSRRLTRLRESCA